MNVAKRLAQVLVLTCLIASPAAAEVMDKLPSVTSLLGPTLLALGVGGVLVYWKPGLIFLVTPLLVMPLWRVTAEIASPAVGSAIWQEAGAPYVAAVYAQLLTVIVVHVAIALWSRRRNRQSKVAGATS
jgi:hypothetical protein